MFGVDFQDFGLEHPMFHHLRGQLHKVARYAEDAVVVNIPEESVKGMPELVEHD